GRVYGCDFDIVVFTNLSQDHLDCHEDKEDYLRAKSLLVAQRGNVYDKERQRFAVINDGDGHSDLLTRSTAQNVLSHGCREAAQVRAKNIQLDVTYTNFTLTTPVGTIDINSRLIGMFNIYNMLAASSAAIAAEVPLNVIKTALEELTGVDGRFEQVVAG